MWRVCLDFVGIAFNFVSRKSAHICLCLRTFGRATQEPQKKKKCSLFLLVHAPKSLSVVIVKRKVTQEGLTGPSQSFNRQSSDPRIIQTYLRVVQITLYRTVDDIVGGHYDGDFYGNYIWREPCVHICRLSSFFSVVLRSSRRYDGDVRYPEYLCTIQYIYYRRRWGRSHIVIIKHPSNM